MTFHIFVTNCRINPFLKLQNWIAKKKIIFSNFIDLFGKQACSRNQNKKYQIKIIGIMHLKECVKIFFNWLLYMSKKANPGKKPFLTQVNKVVNKKCLIMTILNP